MSIKVISYKELSRELGKIPEKARNHMREAILVSIIDTIPELIKSSPVDTGLYAQSWDLVEEEKSLILGNYAPHAAIIEHGARPFTPPLTPLLEWAKRVLGDPSQPPDYSSAVWGLAIYTRNKIQKEGMEPRNVLSDHLNVIIERIKDELK